MKIIFVKTINILIIIMLLSVFSSLISCTQNEIIDYDLEIIETTEEVTEIFAFEKTTGYFLQYERTSDSCSSKMLPIIRPPFIL